MSRKPAYMYRFADEQSAKKFKEYAENHHGSAFVQHPMKKGVDAHERDLTRVLVTGTGSVSYDLLLRSDLEHMSCILEGTFEPYLG